MITKKKTVSFSNNKNTMHYFFTDKVEMDNYCRVDITTMKLL